MLPVERMCFQSLLFHAVLSKLGQSEGDWIPCCSFLSDPRDSPARQERNCCVEVSTKGPRESKSSNWKLDSEIQALSCSLNQLEMGRGDGLCCALHFHRSQGMGGKKDGTAFREGINILICRHVHILGQGKTVPSSLLQTLKKQPGVK